MIDPNINEISTYFDGDVNTYLSEFAKDVTRFIDTMPSLDSNVILGVPPTSLTPAAAHEVVTMAVKLDPSTRTPMPSSACIWIGTQLMKTDEAITTLVPSYPDTPLPPPPPAKPTNLLIDFKKDNRYTHLLTHLLTYSLTYSLTHSPTHLLTHSMNDFSKLYNQTNTDAFISETLLTELRLHVEIDILMRYPILCTQKVADEAYDIQGSLTHSLTYSLTHLLTHPLLFTH